MRRKVQRNTFTEDIQNPLNQRTFVATFSAPRPFKEVEEEVAVVPVPELATVLEVVVVVILAVVVAVVVAVRSSLSDFRDTAPARFCTEGK